MATLRFAPHPLAYWILTTDGDDRRLLESFAKTHPRLSNLELIEQLAARYPHGATGRSARKTAERSKIDSKEERS
jgi:hypothetical protein